MLKKSILFLCLFFTIGMVSCSAVDHADANPPILFDTVYLNQQLRLVAIPQLSAFKTEYPVAIRLEYNTTNQIVLPSNYDLRIFIRQDNKWTEISEKPAIRPKENIVLLPSIPISYNQIVMFSPQLPEPNKSYNMRLYVFGDMTTTDGLKKVASFVDFILTP